MQRLKLFAAIFVIGIVVLVVSSCGTNDPEAVMAAQAEKPWVTASNANARLVLEAQAAFNPVSASQSGLSQYDGLSTDLGPRLSERSIAAMEKVQAELKRRLASEKEVMLSRAMVRQELDRYTFRDPGQAAAYFYGYSRILQLRAETELSLGDKFDRQFPAWSRRAAAGFAGESGARGIRYRSARRAVTGTLRPDR